MKDRICTSCFHVGQPTKQGPGSFFVDALIWLSFISLSVLSSIFVLMIIPIAWTTYHIWVYDKTTCPKCGRLNMVSLTSRKGREALQGPKWVVSYKASEEDQASEEEAPPTEQRRRADDRRHGDDSNLEESGSKPAES